MPLFVWDDFDSWNLVLAPFYLVTVGFHIFQGPLGKWEAGSWEGGNGWREGKPGEGRSARDNSADFTVFHRGLPCLPLLTSKLSERLCACSVCPVCCHWEKNWQLALQPKGEQNFCNENFSFFLFFQLCEAALGTPMPGLSIHQGQRQLLQRCLHKLGQLPRCLTGSRQCWLSVGCWVWLLQSCWGAWIWEDLAPLPRAMQGIRFFAGSWAPASAAIPSPFPAPPAGIYLFSFPSLFSLESFWPLPREEAEEIRWPSCLLSLWPPNLLVVWSPRRKES